jgi:putative DNA methylase
VLVCRSRPAGAPITTRREFLAALRRELPGALKDLQHGGVAPVDLAQAAIGPGMAVFSRYAEVRETDGSPMRVRIALQIINQILDEVLDEQLNEFDQATRWAVTWFEQSGFDQGLYGVAETLSKAKDVGLDGLVETGIVESRAGKVRLVPRDKLPTWNAHAAQQMTVWELTHQLIRALETEGAQGAAEIMDKAAPGRSEFARDLAYRLYNTCDRKSWSALGGAYNLLVSEWRDISEQRLTRPPVAEQASLGFED